MRSPYPRGVAALALIMALCARGVCATGDVPPTPAGIVAPSDEPLPGTRPQIPPAPKLYTVQALDTAIEALRRGIWILHDAQQAHPDPQGPTHAQDVDRWLLTAERDVRLKALRVQAHSQSNSGESAGLAATLQEAATLLGQERDKAYLLWIGWWLQDCIAQHAANLKALEERDPPATPEDRAARQARIALAAVGVSDMLPAAMAANSRTTEAAALQQMMDANNRLLGVYNQERGKLAVALSNRQRVLGREPAAQVRDTPCPPAATRTSGTQSPSLAEGNEPPDSIYPAASRRASFEGVVLVRLWVSETGCPEQAGVAQSSGVADLDAAALAWALQAKFIPAARDGQAVASTPRLPIQFKLRN
jgi:TonB family protein